MNIDLSRFKVIHGESVVRALALMEIEFPENTDFNATTKKPKFIEVMIINSDGNIEILHDEAWTFQFIPILGEKA